MTGGARAIRAEIVRAKASDTVGLDEESPRQHLIQAWIKQGQLWVARSRVRLLGYVVLSQSFFGRSFVEL